MSNQGVVNLEIGEALSKEVAKAFRQSAMFEDWLRVLNDEWIQYGLGIMSADNESYRLWDKLNSTGSQYYSLFLDAYREGLKLYVERVKEITADD